VVEVAVWVSLIDVCRYTPYCLFPIGEQTGLTIVKYTGINAFI
jgi:hypothetical protein